LRIRGKPKSWAGSSALRCAWIEGEWPLQQKLEGKTVIGGR
jgi:hypothetical protein